MEPFDPNKDLSQLELKASSKPSQAVWVPPKSEPASAPVALSVQAIRSLQNQNAFSPTKDALMMEAGLLSLLATPVALYLRSGDLLAALLGGLAAGVAALFGCVIALPIAHWLLNLFRSEEASAISSPKSSWLTASPRRLWQQPCTDHCTHRESPACS